MYEAVTAHPAGESTVARFAHTASEYGYDGLVVRNGHEVEFDTEVIGDSYGIDLVYGIEIEADSPEAAAGAVGGRRNEATVLSLVGGSDALNRFATEEERLDVLSRPMASGGGFNHVLAKAASRNDVRVEFDLGSVLRTSGGARVRTLRDLRLLRKLVRKYDVPFVVSATARSHLELRAPRELRALGEVIGFSNTEIERGLCEWESIAERTREIRSESFIEPGVRRGRYEEER
jgi:ribonuclease P/MRP protein subunit RPP1